MNKERYKTFNDFLLLASFALPTVGFLMTPKLNPFNNNNITIIGRFIVFLIYIIPTIVFILAIIELKKSNYNKSTFNISDFKGIKPEYIRIIFSFSVGVYFLLKGLYYLGIPILLISFDLLIITILNIRYCNKLIYSPWDNENRVSLEKLSKYNKSKGNASAWTEAIILAFPVVIVTSFPLLYFNVIGFNLITVCVYTLSLLAYFITTDAYKQTLDNKYNDFVEYRGKCVGYNSPGKGTVCVHIFEVFNTEDKRVTISSSKPIFKKGQVITLIIGMRSEKVINY